MPGIPKPMLGYCLMKSYMHIALCKRIHSNIQNNIFSFDYAMDLAWASCQIRKIASCACAGNAGSISPRHLGLAIPTCITARAWRTCRDACRDRYLAVFFQIGGGENVPGIPGACAIRDFCVSGKRPMRLFCWAGPLLISAWWNTNGLMFIGIAVSSFKI